jgi:hypothetical protein
MFLQAIEMDEATKPPVVSTLEQDAVIVYLSGHVDAPMQMPLPLRAIELKGKRLASHLHALLILDVLLNHFQTDSPNRRNELAPRPKAGQTLFQPWVFGAKDVRGVSLDLPDNGHDAHLRVGIQKQVDVIGPDFHAQYGVSVVGLLLFNQCLESTRERLLKHLAAILWAPNHMVLAAIHQGRRRMVGFARLFEIHLLTPLDRMESIYHKRSHLAIKKHGLKAKKSAFAVRPKPEVLGFTAQFP